MEQFLIVILASGLNERMILIGIVENVIVWWKICMYLGGKWVERSGNGWACCGKSPIVHPQSISNTYHAFFNKLQHGS